MVLLKLSEKGKKILIKMARRENNVRFTVLPIDAFKHGNIISEPQR